METQRDIRLFELLGEAAGWPRSERRDRAEAACAEGPVRVDELLSALDHTERLTQFLEEPAWQSAEASERLDAYDVGDTVGRYRLLEVLGEGGMGRVFLAEQQDPERKVALKLVRADFVGAEGRERFRSEQQALARLNHPHVAQFYEADVTDDGQPYFAMEWIDGEPIDVFFARRRPDLELILGVFLDVCSAVRHAHQKQVIHRDLKPSNILVREVEGRPVAKVIDFGISEALEGGVGDADESGSRPGLRGGLRAGGFLYGTPEYLSPESFEGDVDTRVDVYALGVLLYELLSGARPFSRADPRREDQPIEELIRRIVTGDKILPSVAAAGVDDRSPQSWASRLRGDLDAVILKAMHPDRDLRYASVADLASDVQAFQAHRPVEARDPGWLHGSRLLVRRRWRPLLAASVAVLSLLAGGVGLATGMLRAQKEAATAQVALEESEQLVLFLSELFQEADPGQAQGDELTAREILDQGAERLRVALKEQPLARARLLRTIGDIYAKLGHFEPAESLLEESLDLYRENAADDLTQLARAHSGLAVMETKAGDLEAAQQEFEQALAILDEDPGADPEARALVVYHLGVVAYRQNQDDAAESYFDAACGDLGADDESEFSARCFEAFGALRERQGRLEDVRKLLLQSLRIRENLLGRDHPHVAQSLESLCLFDWRQERFDESLQSCARCYDIRRRVLGPDHPETVVSLSRLARRYREAGRKDEAEEAYVELARTHAEAPRPSAELNALALSAWGKAAWLAWLHGDYTEAKARYRQVIDLASATEQEESSNVWYAELGLGLSDWKLGRLEAAEPRLRELHEQVVHTAIEARIAWTAWGLAGVYRDRGQAGDRLRAGTLYELALEIRRRDNSRREYFQLVEDDYRTYQELRGAAE